ncbi:MAG TPA: electron transport complex subunit RsxC [Deltaproteobacteria bacterium]|jgi:electron transport complex protein RnfC|nr:electron transport complex subunit RsxC [Deltaproteobacteria bacterium]HOI07101.1 electron transport complex subunit RsxC [Deltaproteobacteria bacterium]
MSAFKGGVHPPEEKALVRDKAIETFPLSPLYHVLVQQHLGAPARPIVKAGDQVKKGQVLTEPMGFVSVPVHAPTSGRVRDVGKMVHPVTGLLSPCIVIEADGNDEWADGLPLERDPFSMAKDEFLEAIRNAGIVGMGGATFPTHVKLSPPEGKSIDTLIINGVECEPYLSSDHRLMLEEPEKVIKGTKVAMRVLGLDRAVIAIEGNKPDAVRVMKEKAPREIQVSSLAVKYPQGSEKQLIKALTNREVPSGGLPMDVGTVVQNAGTAAAIWDACSSGIPLIERITSVTGRGVRDPKNIRVRVGTVVRDVIEFCGGLEGAAKIIFGGPMMGIAQFTQEIPVMKGTSGILVLTEKDTNISDYSACISCGRCVEACPMGLIPSTLSKLGERGMWEEASKIGLMDCIECGCCTYVCPARRPIVHFIKHLKALSRAAASKKKGA